MQRIVETCNEETCDPMQAARHLEQIRNWALLAMADLHGNGGDGPREVRITLVAPDGSEETTVREDG